MVGRDTGFCVVTSTTERDENVAFAFGVVELVTFRDGDVDVFTRAVITLSVKNFFNDLLTD
jgi:hypothetical protein